MGQTIDSHANYEGISKTPLQRRIEQRVSNGLGYSDQHNCSRLYPEAFPASFEAEPVKVYSGDGTRYQDSNRAIQTSLMLLDTRAGIHHEIEYTPFYQSPLSPSNFGYGSLSGEKKQSPLDRLGNRLRGLVATAEISFASPTERKPSYDGSSFTKNVTPLDEGLKLPRYPTADDETCHVPGAQRVGGINYLYDNCNELPPRREELEFFIGGKKVLLSDPNLDAALLRIFERAGVEEPENCERRPLRDGDSTLIPRPLLKFHTRYSDPLALGGSSESYQDTGRAPREFDEELERVPKRLEYTFGESIIIKDPQKGSK